MLPSIFRHSDDDMLSKQVKCLHLDLTHLPFITSTHQVRGIDHYLQPRGLHRGKQGRPRVSGTAPHWPALVQKASVTCFPPPAMRRAASIARKRSDQAWEDYSLDANDISAGIACACTKRNDGGSQAMTGSRQTSVIDAGQSVHWGSGWIML